MDFSSASKFFYGVCDWCAHLRHVNYISWARTCPWGEVTSRPKYFFGQVNLDTNANVS